MRNPNSYGSIYKNNDTKRRKPWVVRITLGFEEVNGKARQIRKTIGTFATKKEAQLFLYEYHDKHYNVNFLNYTFSDVYNKMLDSKKSISRTTLNSYRMAFNILEPIHNIKFNDLKLSHFQEVVNTCNKEYHTLRKLKSCISVCYDFALKNEIYNGNNLSEWIDIGKDENKEKEIFTDGEVEILWKNKDKDICKIILILIYSGLRISELLDLRKENVNLEERYLDIKQGKTENSIRKVPISLKTLPFIKEFYDKNDEFLVVNRLGKQFKYSNFKREYFDRTKESLGLNPNISIHSTRHTCVSKLVKCGKVPPTMIKLIIGHSSNELFEKTYTHLDIKELIKYIDMI